MSKILVVDDDEGMQRFCRFVLEEAGHSVTVAPNGRAAIEAFQADPFNLVLCDIHMPEKDGIETIMELRRDYPLVRIVAMSGGGVYPQLRPVLLRSASALGAATTLQKPFTQAD